MSGQRAPVVYQDQYALNFLDIFCLAGVLKILLMNAVFPSELYIICRPML
jgi:hypothetical protein